jgi:chromosome segregation ATPase
LMLMRCREINDVYQRLTDVSTQSSVKLDEVYYSILEKMNILKATVAGLQETYDQARGLSGQFEGNAQSMQKDLQEQAETFEGFREQTRQVQALEDRLMRGREKMDSLSGRLETAKDRVRQLETQEAEVQKSISCKYLITSE